MEVNYAIPVHLCSLCGKPFTQERQHRRHQAYCRRNQSRLRTRPRSCRACNQAKIKCNFRDPCNQCTRKGLDCVYEPSRKEPVANDAPITISDFWASHSTHGLEQVSTSNLLGHGLDRDSLGLLRPGDMPDLDSDGLFTMPATEFNWGGSRHKEISSVGDLQMPTTFSSDLDTYMSLLQSDDLDLTSDTSTSKTLDLILPAQVSTPLSIPSTEISTTRVHFSRNKIVTPAQQLFTSMLVDMIRAYPLMMTRRETFPPFVHPHCYLYEGCDTFPQVLTNCMGIAQLFVSRTDDTRPFVWTTVMAEVRSVLTKVII
ncbi:hypothetical protein TSTA_031440 [Talaromyces stipitatus ATCC 10500]|uniref:Zn(2)-C6 fungal-type domain-containing protein n=1 Tax=Talaromyces stipitatus (strain ATCC 10500 / CBS 375.48 / QM 6759 / NRRL 1006) TaxID=441959 RepID=B8M5J1_TALSN|nr:uncharacterized protein TSTA_031440 [Talaromyces stipitatus ATCC 10500]EED19885.1 hypothetical protein TSTA_031440 [Talaromyces stipitatus ATCC 10500]